MPNVFTTFATSRFIDAKAVIEQLQRCAAELKARRDEVERIYLFGSFAKGTATPRSDADIAIQAVLSSTEQRSRLLDAAREIFSKAPVPVDIHLIAHDEPSPDRGLPGVVFQEGIEL